MALNQKDCRSKQSKKQNLIVPPRKVQVKSLRQSIDLVTERKGLSNSLVVPVGLLQKQFKFKNYKKIKTDILTSFDANPMEIYSKDAANSYQVFTKSPDQKQFQTVNQQVEGESQISIGLHLPNIKKIKSTRHQTKEE